MNVTKYNELRARGYSVKEAGHFARHVSTVPHLDWQEDSRGDAYAVAKVERDGFSLTVKAKYDYDTDRSDDDGEFVLRREDHDTYPTEPCAKARRRSKWQPALATYEEHGMYNYFRPNETVADLRKYFAKQGMSRGVAEEKAREQIARVVKYATDHDNKFSLYIVVRAYKAGIELGSASLWGIEFTWDQKRDDVFDYLDECASDMIAEALNEAKKALANLVASA